MNTAGQQVVGKRHWAFSCGCIPLESHGKEPDFCSHDKIAMLNVSEETAMVEITIFYEDKEPVGTYCIKVAPRRMRKIRLNDLIDPQAIPLETHYGCHIKSNVPVVVQFSRMDTGARNTALFATMAFMAEDG